MESQLSGSKEVLGTTSSWAEVEVELPQEATVWLKWLSRKLASYVLGCAVIYAASERMADPSMFVTLCGAVTTLFGIYCGANYLQSKK